MGKQKQNWRLYGGTSKDDNIKELKNHLVSVIDWVSTVFSDVETEMRGLDWERLYETFKKQPYSPQKCRNK